MPTIQEAILIIIAVLSAGYSVYAIVAIVQTIRHVPLLERLSPPTPTPDRKSVV